MLHSPLNGKDRKISKEFITYASSILGDTSFGFSGSQIVEITSKYAVKYNVSIPHSSPTLEMCNKKTALSDNLNAFEQESHVFEILILMCKELNSKKSKELRLELIKNYGYLDTNQGLAGVNIELIEQTRHWLSEYPDVLEVFNSTIQKQSHGLYKRNLLDDLRLSLELLLKTILGNDKSLENQTAQLGTFMIQKGSSKELTNMFCKLIDYYTKYQNTYVKHGDEVNEEEIEFLLTASFMKHFIRLEQK